ncbi:hypothetical protein [Stenotrophomonas sp. NPDC077659]|uniref:hypothetical protein n=1 Tax=Stenotrophomonas sp. NPDC077659 TaxID=3390694 RepID=UPI003CFC6184
MTQHVATAAAWKTEPLPDCHVTLALDFHLDAAEAACAGKGLIPLDMEDKWFLYYAGQTLHLHRSWTGFCIAQVHFVTEGDGLRATCAWVNRDPGQYASTDDAADIALIERMVRSMGASQRYLAERLAWSAS